FPRAVEGLYEHLVVGERAEAVLLTYELARLRGRTLPPMQHPCLGRVHRSTFSLRQWMANPHIGLVVNALASFPVDADGREGMWHDVVAAHRKFHSGPLLPLLQRALDRQRAGRRAQHLGTNSQVGAEPGIEGLAVVVDPADVLVDGRQRIATLQHR